MEELNFLFVSTCFRVSKFLHVQKRCAKRELCMMFVWGKLRAKKTWTCRMVPRARDHRTPSSKGPQRFVVGTEVLDGVLDRGLISPIWRLFFSPGCPFFHSSHLKPADWILCLSLLVAECLSLEERKLKSETENLKTLHQQIEAPGLLPFD